MSLGTRLRALFARWFGRPALGGGVAPAGQVTATLRPAIVPANRLDTLCVQYGGTYDRTRRADGTVVVRMHFADGDIAVGRGATTADAIEALATRLARTREAAQ